MLLIRSPKWHDLGSRDSCESGFSNNRNPHHWKQRASQHRSPCRLRVIKPVKDNQWPNQHLYQLKDQDGDQRGRGGVNGSRIKFFSKIMKPAEEECDQSDIRLASYNQNSHQTLLLKWSGGHVEHWTGYVWYRPDISRKRGYMSGPPRNFLLNFDSWGTRHQIGWNLNIRVTSTQGTSSQRSFFPNPKISHPILDELKESRFRGKRGKSTKSKELEPWIHSKVRGRWSDSS
jgi:hypothetical protein